MKPNKDIDKALDDWGADFDGQPGDDFLNAVELKIESRISERRTNRRILQIAAAFLILINSGLVIEAVTNNETVQEKPGAEYFADYDFNIYENSESHE